MIRRFISSMFVLAAIMVVAVNVTHAQSEDYDGPAGFEWSTPSPSADCTSVNSGALVLGEPTGVIDAEEHNAVIQFANPDPEWVDDYGEPVTQIFVIFDTGYLHTSNIRIPAHIWYFSTECTVDDAELLEQFLFPLMDELEQFGEESTFYYADDLYNSWWVSETFPPVY